jgi:ribosomal protein S18 acetylase RimI-like enzyme
VTLERGGAELIGEIEPLWLALFDHHLAVGAAGLRTVDRDQTWPRRRALYEQLLAAPDAFVVLARRDGTAAAYALVRIHEGADDTWATGERIAELESIAVVPAERGRGLGTLLLDAVDARLDELGIRDVMVAVLVGNDAAEALYRRRGWVPAMTKMLRLGDAPAR